MQPGARRSSRFGAALTGMCTVAALTATTLILLKYLPGSRD